MIPIRDKQVLENIEAIINSDESSFYIDTIRVEFSKEYTINKLKEIGSWIKINPRDRQIYKKLTDRLAPDEVSNAYRLENHNIYYYNKRDRKRRKAMMVIFGLKQYHKEPPPRDIIISIISILKNITSIDLCYDSAIKPDINKLIQLGGSQCFIDKSTPTSTYYINSPHIPSIERITVYDKQFKNNLIKPLWRFEAQISIINPKEPYIPLFELLEMIDYIYPKERL